jgi:sugar-specific transcriptional regulator TrmB
MINDQETIKKTKTFGLNTYEARIWTALLSRGVSTAGELSDIANVPRSRSYDVLESLEKKGFVVMKLGKPIKYIPIPPKEVLENIKKQIEKKTEKHLSDIKNTGFNKLINTFQELYEKNTDQTEDMVAILKGRRNIHKHLGFLFKNAKKEILFSVKGETEENLKIVNDTKNKIKTPIKLQDIGVRISIVDEDNSVVFPVREEEVHPDYDLCIWIRNKHITKFLKHLFTSV